MITVEHLRRLPCGTPVKVITLDILGLPGTLTGHIAIDEHGEKVIEFFEGATLRLTDEAPRKGVTFEIP